MNRKPVALLLQLIYLAVALVIGRTLSADTAILPKSFLHVQNPPISIPVLLNLVGIHLAIGLPLFLLNLVMNRDAVPPRAKFTIAGLLMYTCVSSLSATFIYFFTEIVFSAHFFAAAFGAGVVIYLVGFFVLGFLGKDHGESYVGWLMRSRFWGTLGRTLFSVPALVVIILAVTPVFFATQYQKNPAIANFVTNAKLKFLGAGDEPWGLVDVYPGLRFSQTMEVAYPTPGATSAYVLERGGRIYRVKNESPEKELLVDFSERVNTCDVEDGAAGFAFHPRFAVPDSPNQGYVYVYHTDVQEFEKYNRLSRFDLSLATPQERLESETILFEIEPGNRTGFHNGGGLEFVPDGFLYLGMGDLNDRNTPQNISTDFFSGIIRIDVDMRGEDVSHAPPREPENGISQNYFIPNDNPFVGQEGVLEEFWALGFRNPYRMTFDSLTRKMWVSEVGADLYEEVNIVDRGTNHQWNYREGFEQNRDFQPPSPPIGVDTPPFFAYEHTAVERAVIGGLVYRDDRYPDLYGKYIFADNFSGRLRSIDIDDGAEQEWVLLTRADQLGQMGITSLMEAPTGDVYITTLGSKLEPSGRLMKLVRGAVDSGGAPPDSMVVSRLSPQGSLPEARQMFKDNCSRCHGATGQGDGAEYDDPEVPLPDFSTVEWQEQRAEEDIILAIAAGGEAAGLSATMPAWGDSFSNAQIQMLMRVIREFAYPPEEESGDAAVGEASDGEAGATGALDAPGSEADTEVETKSDTR